MQIEQFICGNDNFGVLIHDETTNLTATIDAPSGEAILHHLERHGFTLDYIFITHHHDDHTAGINFLKNKTGAQVIGPEKERAEIIGLDQAVKEGDAISFGNNAIKIIETPGHTLGSICYYFPSPGVVFTGDTLFSLGCGRLFEGTPEMMLGSLKKLRALPDATQIYCGHEYTLSNALFALSLDPENEALIKRIEEVKTLIARGRMTLPSTIGQEKTTNPFLRWDNEEIRQHLDMKNASDEMVFAAIRQAKDHFK